VQLREHDAAEYRGGDEQHRLQGAVLAEYRQTKIRYEKLKAFNTKIEAARRVRYYKHDAVQPEEPKHDYPDDLLIDQQNVMGQYLHILEVRAVIEGIEL
jgi:hypothetical protein